MKYLSGKDGELVVDGERVTDLLAWTVAIDDSGPLKSWTATVEICPGPAIMAWWDKPITCRFLTDDDALYREGLAHIRRLDDPHSESGCWTQELEGAGALEWHPTGRQAREP
jgi:hypothetical protein